MTELPPTFNPAIPIVTSISGYSLKQAGFMIFNVDKPKGRQAIITTYKKGKIIVTYDGVSFVQNGKRIDHIEDIQW